MDTITPQKRSWVMSRVGGKNTKPELIMRALLHRAGYRYKLNDKTLPGKPDIVLPKHTLAVFIHGCFWHRHKNCRHATMPQSNRQYWQNKFAANQRKDERAKRRLNALGWRTLTLWECRIKKDPHACLARLIRKIATPAPQDIPYAISRQQLLQAAERKWRYLKK